MVGDWSVVVGRRKLMVRGLVGSWRLAAGGWWPVAVGWYLLNKAMFG